MLREKEQITCVKPVTHTLVELQLYPSEFAQTVKQSLRMSLASVVAYLCRLWTTDERKITDSFLDGVVDMPVQYV